MQQSSDKPAGRSDVPTTDFLKRRLNATAEGLKEGVRREVARLRKLGLPIYVAENGTVVNRQKPNTIPNAAEP